MDEWWQTVESYSLEISGNVDDDTIVVKENGVVVDPLRAAELIGEMRFALGDSIADVAGLPAIREG